MLDILMKNEAKHADMIDILKELVSYLGEGGIWWGPIDNRKADKRSTSLDVWKSTRRPP